MRDANRPDLSEQKKPSVVKRGLVVIVVTALLLGAAGYAALSVLFRGPFLHAAAAFTQEVGHYPAVSFVIDYFLTPEQRQDLTQIEPGTGLVNGETARFSIHPKIG